MLYVQEAQNATRPIRDAESSQPACRGCRIRKSLDIHSRKEIVAWGKRVGGGAFYVVYFCRDFQETLLLPTADSDLYLVSLVKDIRMYRQTYAHNQYVCINTYLYT